MQLLTTVYLPGLCNEAIAFYRTVLGAELVFIRHIGDVIEPGRIAPGTERRILRAALRIGASTLYFSDGHGTQQPGHQGFSLSLDVPTLTDAERTLQALSEGGRILLPLRPTTWANTYGVAIDRFGLHWTVETVDPGPMA